MKKALLVALWAGIVALALAGCGPKPPVEVQVTLTEFGIEASQSTFKVGQPYRFVVTNEGALAHEFMVSAPLMAGMDTGHPGAPAGPPGRPPRASRRRRP